MDKNRVLARLVFIAICIKLIISPWATGDFLTSVGKMLNYFCDGIFLLAVVLHASSLQKQYLYIYMAATISGLTYALSTFLFTDKSPISMLSMHLKIYLPLLAIPVLLQSYHMDKVAFLRAVKRLCLLVGSLLLLGFLILPDSLNRLEVWWPSYFSGLHSTSYVALMLMFLVYALYKHVEIKKEIVVSVVVLLSLSIYFGWGVRTATLASLIFLIGLIASNFQLSRMPIYHHIVHVAILFIVIGLAFVNFDHGFDNFTSGRLSMYAEKYDQLSNNNMIQWIIGNGFGSDLIETDIWWWGEKGAHSDLITMLVEGGGVYLFLFLWVMFRLWDDGAGEMKSVLIAVLVTALFSNGVFVRPVAGYLLAISLVLFVDMNRRIKVVL